MKNKWDEIMFYYTRVNFVKPRDGTGVPFIFLFTIYLLKPIYELQYLYTSNSAIFRILRYSLPLKDFEEHHKYIVLIGKLFANMCALQKI